MHIRYRAVLLHHAVAGLILWLFALPAQGHQDPWGEIHPQVVVMDGKFVIDFRSNLPDEESSYPNDGRMLRMIYNADGTLFAPRHTIVRKRSHREMGPAGLYGKIVRLGDSTLSFGLSQSSKPGYILKTSDGKLSTVYLPWSEKTGLYMFEDVVVTSKEIVITGKEFGRDGESDRDSLFFYWFAHGESDPPVRMDIGKTACIYDFPVASNIAFAGGRFWVGLMKKVDEEMKLALWSWKPGEKEGRMEILDSPADWNSHLSLAAIDDQLCLAYHCVIPGEERDEWYSRILTVFHKAE